MKTLLTQICAPLKQATSLVAGLSIAATSLLSLSHPANAAPRTTSRTIAAASATVLPNGVYLYGQSAEPDQIGNAYFVFEVRQGKLLGALYMPRSSFDCTYGSVNSDKLALTVVGTYDKVESPYAIAMERNSSVASSTNPAVVPVGLEGFQRLDKVSDNDRRILDTCKANYQQRVWK